MGALTTWVATFDGAEARVYETDRSRGRLHRVEEAAFLNPHTPERGEAMTMTGRRVMVENEPPVLSEREDLFVGRVADHLAERAREGAFDKLIVVAEPRALGMFRKCASQPLKTRIVVEIDRDHVHTPVKQLEQALSEHL